MKQTKEEFACRLVELFPEKADSLKQHYDDYGELLAHVFFSYEITALLFDLLLENETSDKIKVYCSFIEDMWKKGTDDVVNVVDVTIAERLPDDVIVWEHFGRNITDEFIIYINNDLLVNNLMMCGVSELCQTSQNT